MKWTSPRSTSTPILFSIPTLLTAVFTLCLVVSSPASGRVPGASTENTYTWQPVVMPAETAAGPSLAMATPTASPQVGGTTASSRPSPTARPTSRPSHSLVGTASWGDFGGHVVTRLPRGTRIVVVGPHGTWRGRSWGYGPAKWTHRIVDLDVHVFEDICGPRSLGLCKVSLSW